MFKVPVKCPRCKNQVGFVKLSYKTLCCSCYTIYYEDVLPNRMGRIECKKCRRTKLKKFPIKESDFINLKEPCDKCKYIEVLTGGNK